MAPFSRSNLPKTRVAVGTLLALPLMLLSSSAHAFSFSAESINSWSSCDSDCDKDALSYCDDQVSMFIDEMQSAGHTKDHWYHNTNVWAEDVTEDEFSGSDDFYTDPHRLYIYSGHGAAKNVDGVQRFRAPFCKKGSTDSCRWYSNHVYLGEKSGGYSSPKAGSLRWMILCACESVHTKPDEQWGTLLRYGTDMIFGYRGLSADSENTDEVPEDFAEEAFSDDDKLKGAWFWAVEDWWVDDVGALIASGSTRDQAIDRRNNMRRTWSGRTTTQHTWFAWSWHEG